MRNEKIDAIKGICIILMVIGHSGCPDLLRSFIYCFHMPCFFLVSGYLFRENYYLQPKQFVWKRCKSLYWPFVKWSFLFLFFHNFFYSVFFYSTCYGLQDYLYKSVKILTMTGSEQLLGGFWFLKESFYSSIISFVVLLINYQYRLLSNMAFIVIGLLLFACLYSYSPVKLPAIGVRTLLASAYFVTGYVMMKYVGNKVFNLPKAIGLSMAVFVLLFSLCCNSWDMEIVEYRVPIYYMVSLAGILFVFSIVSCIKGAFRRYVVLAGRHSLDILVFHFLLFKLVSVCIVACFDMPVERIAEFPVIKDCNALTWVVYAVIGVSLSLVIGEMLDQLNKCIHKKLSDKVSAYG